MAGQRGPLSPGDLALQIAPWPSGPPLSDGASGIRLPGPRERAGQTRVLPAVGASGAAGVAGAAGAARGAAGPTEVFPPAGRPAERTQTLPGAAVPAAPAAAVGAAGAGSGAGAPVAGGAAGLAAAGAAAAGAAAAIGDRVGSFARAAADKAAARAAERRAAHTSRHNHDDGDFEGDDDGEEMALVDALEASPEAELEPPLPVFGREAPERPSGAQSRIALAIVGVLVLVALVIGIQNVAKIGSDGDAVANAVVTVTATRSPSSAPGDERARADLLRTAPAHSGLHHRRPGV